MQETLTHVPSCADDYDPTSLSIELARERIQQALQPIADQETLSLRQCLNRVVASVIHSPRQVPAHTNSAMDGYAIAGSDLPDNDNASKIFDIIGTALAGSPFTSDCQSGQAIRIMTGAVIPQGCDTVIMQEHVEVLAGKRVKIAGGHQKGQNVRPAGEDVDTGDTVLKPGRQITPADMGILASLGISEIRVFRRPRVAFFSTGDELCSVGETLQQGQIYDSNRYSLYGMLQRLGVEILDMGIVPDDPDAMHAALTSASHMADVVITSGGVSVGEADYIKTTLEALGDIHFWKVSMKPGRPLTFGKINQAHFFGLPGNPVSVMVTFYQFVQPALHYLASGKTHYPMTLTANCTSRLKKRPGRFEFQRGIYQQAKNGQLVVSKTGEQGSGILRSMSQANCFILLPVESQGAEPGETVEIQPFEGFI